MKKIQLLTSIILTLLMIIAPQSIALAADDSTQASAKPYFRRFLR